MAYNVTARDCQAIDNSTNNSTNSSSNTSSTLTALGFVPLPFCMVGVVAVMVVMALHLSKGVYIYGSMFGVVAGLQFGAIVAVFAVLANDIISTSSTPTNNSTVSRLLAQTQTQT